MPARKHLRTSGATVLIAVATATAVSLPATAPARAEAPAISTSTTQSAGPVLSSVAVATGMRRARASVGTGPSKWRGNRLRHPNGSKFHWRVKRWANLVQAVLYEHRVKRRYVRGVLAQIQQESGGNPAAVNRWDINARNGTPSKGLLQVIAPTYRAHAKPGYRQLRYQTVPYTNIWAAFKYVKRNYGMKKFRYWNRGYNQGY
jgi:hypothetical protein